MKPRLFCNAVTVCNGPHDYRFKLSNSTQPGVYGKSVVQYVLILILDNTNLHLNSYKHIINHSCVCVCGGGGGGMVPCIAVTSCSFDDSTHACLLKLYLYT